MTPASPSITGPASRQANVRPTLKTIGVHASPDRVVVVHEDNVGVSDDQPVGPKLMP